MRRPRSCSRVSASPNVRPAYRLACSCAAVSPPKDTTIARTIAKRARPRAPCRTMPLVLTRSAKHAELSAIETVGQIGDRQRDSERGFGFEPIDRAVKHHRRHVARENVVLIAQRPPVLACKISEERREPLPFDAER